MEQNNQTTQSDKTNEQNNQQQQQETSIENNPVFKEIVEFGFDKEMIKIAMKFTTAKEEIINMIVKMLEDPDFYYQLKNAPQGNISEQDNNYKMVILVREDLHMSMGKTAAQVGHAVLGAYKLSQFNAPNNIQMWENYNGQVKIVLAVPGEKELITYQKKANENRIITYMVIDAGRTEVEPNTCTCLAIGPHKTSEIDKITGELKLLK